MKLEQLKIDAKNDGWPWPITHPNDERALLNGCYPDFEAAERVRRFYKKLLVLPKEGGGTKPFHLLDWWYRDVIAPLFGWKRKDGRRRFDKGFITTAKKSGKSTVLAGLPMYMVLADGEEEAEAYAAATDRDQATIIYRKTLRSVRLSQSLSQVVRPVDSQKKIYHDASGSIFEAISSDADSAEGKNPHLLIADEVHVWRDRQFFNSLMYGDIVRTQPLFLMITTAGDDAESIGYEEYEFAKDLLNPDTDFYSESHFAFIAEAPLDVDWDEEEAWLAAQPSLQGIVDEKRPRDKDDLPPEPVVIGNVSKLAAKCDEAKKSPRKQREFIRYICNRWALEDDEAWLSSELWEECAGESHNGTRPCYIGLDLAMARDLCAICVATDCDGIVDLEWKFWTPTARVREWEDAWRVPLRDWVDQGWVLTSGDAMVDYQDIRDEVLRIRSQREITCIAYDPWNASQLVEAQLRDQDGIFCEAVRQGYQSLNAPSKDFERMIAERQLRHGNNPVMNWMVRHCIVDEDPAGNIKPNKKKSRHKIDGIIAAIMALVAYQKHGQWSTSEVGL